MKNKYLPKYLQLICVSLIVVVVASCKKDKTSAVNATPTSLGLFELDSAGYYRVFIPLSKIGTQTINYDLVFDTGSAGLSLDASGTIPDSLITKTGNIKTGFKFTGDSIVVNGITITSQTGEMDYGDNVDATVVKGNIAYANITIDNNSGGITIKRVPFFLYYAAFDVPNGNTANETQLDPHSVDIFGVSPEYSYASNLIQSPLSYYKPGNGLTNGFKLAKLIKADFTNAGIYEQSILTLGLTQSDLTSNGFIMHTCSYTSVDGYSPDIPGTVSYSGNPAISANFLFDTGTPQITIIEDKTANSLGQLPNNSVVTLKTNEGFTYTYTATATNNITNVQNPKISGDTRSILSLEFFIDNEFLTDYAGHQIGLKNN